MTPEQFRPYTPPGRPIKALKPNSEARRVPGYYNVEDRRSDREAIEPPKESEERDG